jgi:protein-L-isoaspartate(D-aspartate) O-methyltransferase
MTRLTEIRRFYAQLMAAASGSTDPKLERIFELVPREAFFPPGPWKVMVNHRYFETPSADPVFLYQNVLIALDADKGINNGEPFLHAAWIGKTAPQPGETVTHVGVGTGYYTAILAMLVLPAGQVHGFEIDESLAAKAKVNLEPFENAKVIAGNAVSRRIPASDLIYVNAGVVAPPAHWLKALRPGGRMIFPWRPSEKIGLAMLVTRTEAGFACEPFMRAWFIPCIGAANADPTSKIPTAGQERLSRSIWLTAEKAPDETAIAVFNDVWFSYAPVSTAPLTPQC